MRDFNCESEVRAYSRLCPIVFHTARGSVLQDNEGREYIDFLSGAGALNYGHNNPYIKQRVLDYISMDGVIHALDFHTTAKRTFYRTLYALELAPKGLEYKIQLCGPTGTNAVEAALKLARRVTGRATVYAFMGAYHGVSLGSLAVTASKHFRQAAGVPLGSTSFVPFESGPWGSLDSLAYLRNVIEDDHSGYDKPAAIIVETVQGEGGIIPASIGWLRGLRDLCDEHGILLLCDDIQAGCGRTGPFFSFERAGIVPDMVMLSKSVSGYGLPMALLLLKPEHDRWRPGEHSGTFRGHQLAFVAGAAALEYRREHGLEQRTLDAGERTCARLRSALRPSLPGAIVRGLGLFIGVDLTECADTEAVGQVVRRCVDRGLIIERAGRGGLVIKVLPALTIEPELLDRGCDILVSCILDVLGSDGRRS